jgi:hypothetical protein
MSRFLDIIRAAARRVGIILRLKLSTLAITIGWI